MKYYVILFYNFKIFSHIQSDYKNRMMKERFINNLSIIIFNACVNEINFIIRELIIYL